ncbi:DNA helicase Pif1 like protein, partial [Entophlyctis helioformis]
MSAVAQSRPFAAFIDGPAGSGKTFTLNAILSQAARDGHEAVAVAMTGAAASLLKGGTTFHSRFRVPLSEPKRPGEEAIKTNAFSLRSDSMRSLIKKTDIIVIDQAAMLSCSLMHTLNSELISLTRKNVLFGGKAVVMAGDFRQILPIVPWGSDEDVSDATISNSPLFSKLVHFRLEGSRRISEDDEVGRDYAEWLTSNADGDK